MRITYGGPSSWYSQFHGSNTARQFRRNERNMLFNVILMVAAALTIVVSMSYAIHLAVVQSHDCTDHGTRRNCTRRPVGEFVVQVPARILVQQHGAR